MHTWLFVGVEVRVPAFLPGDADYLEGVVVANYSSGAPITGNVSLRASVRSLEHYQSSTTSTSTTSSSSTSTSSLPALTHPHAMFAGVFPFKFRVSDLAQLVRSDGGGGGGGGWWEARVEAVVGDAYQDSTHTAYALTRVFSPDIHLEFLGGSPQVLRPAMPFKFYLTARMQDGSQVPGYRLARHRLLVTPEVRLHTGERRPLQPRTLKMTHATHAIWEAELEVRAELPALESAQEVESLHLEAELKDSEGSRSHASLVTVVHHSPHGHHLQVTTSTRSPKVGEYVILHVRSNYYLDQFRYILLSKGMVVEAGQQNMEASLKTFPLPLTSEVAGVATVVVYAAGRDQDLVADALTFPVDALTRKGLHVSLNQDTDTHDTLTITVSATPGSRVSLTGVNWEMYSMQTGNDLTHAKVLEALWGGKERRTSGRPLEQRWVSGEGLPDDILHLPRASPGLDPNTTLRSADLLVLTDGTVPTIQKDCSDSDGIGVAGSNRGVFGSSNEMAGWDGNMVSLGEGLGEGRMPGLHQCQLRGCYSSHEQCDGKFDCEDRVDEQECETAEGTEAVISQYRRERTSRLAHHFSPPWLWAEVKVGDSGSAALTVPLPPGPAHLTLSAFSLHPDHGMTILPAPVLWYGSRGFWLSVEAPGKVAVWEQVGVRVTAVNHFPHPVLTVIVLTNSPHYMFVDVHEFDPIDPSSQKQRRTVIGEHEHTVVVEGGETHTLYLPIVPITLGTITVRVQASVKGRKLQKEVTIFVEPPGALQENHTSLLLDLTNRAYFFTFLDVAIPAGHVPGSAEAHVSVFGGSVGPVQSTIPPTPTSLLGLPSVGCEPVAFSFLLRVEQLQYWQEVQQEPPMDEKLVFRHLEQLYQTLLVYQNKDGGFKYYRTSRSSSVWVTSLVVRALNTAINSWPHLLYVDPQVTDKAIQFVLGQQAGHGAWLEPEGAVGDRKLVPPQYSLTGTTTQDLNLTTTALTIITLTSLQGLPSPLDEHVLVGAMRGSGWLGENLAIVGEASRPLEVSLVALALHLTSSPHASDAFHILSRNARQEVSYVYWGEDLVPLPSYRVESQRPHLQPRHPHTHDAGNVAATAYALRLYCLRGEVLTQSIVRWLHSQRSHDGGWRSTQDTLAAWEALREYSRREGQEGDTRISVTVEPLHDHTLAHTFYTTPANLLHLQTHRIKGTWESVRVQGKGRGSAVLQLTTRYYVTEPDLLVRPPTPAFHLTPHASWHGHNGSSIVFTVCVRWLFREASETSGAAVLEVTVPTGYGTSTEALQNPLSEVPHLRHANFTQRKASFFFERLSGNNTCVEFSVERWFPVANLTTVLPIKVYEYYSPELYQMELLDISSVTLDICQVCGSYQCPNCPVLSYYSSQSPSLHLYHLLLPLLLSLFLCLAPS
ncbi:hypothetical protein Pcinc_014206 [Petrolisthes cinctipes]|uniref:Uncharacterized protein n=1 Tax=Petrolisthes cinctipes TaxID=88211 RepID=A0AAE1KTH2_PETCI|nr:hypothetical protein Pcinc_014206 [Petrolisthes cinctipes]